MWGQVIAACVLHCLLSLAMTLALSCNACFRNRLGFVGASSLRLAPTLAALAKQLQKRVSSSIEGHRPLTSIIVTLLVGNAIRSKFITSHF